MTIDEFRRLALSFPEATEQSHMNHPDFRVRNKIFASIGPKGDVGMVKLTPEEQQEFLDAEPDVFAPASGAWGRGGATMVKLRSARKASVRRALHQAWRNTAPKSLADPSGDES